MVRRLCSLALAAVIVGAPVASALCQLSCASHDSEVMTSALATPMAGHVHHHHPVSPSPAPTHGPSVTPGPQMCSLPSDDAVGVQQTLQLLTAPAIVSVNAFALAAPVNPALLARAQNVQLSPPGTLALITQLRV